MDGTQRSDGISTLIDHKALNIRSQTVGTQRLESDAADAARRETSSLGKERDVVGGRHASHALLAVVLKGTPADNDLTVEVTGIGQRGKITGIETKRVIARAQRVAQREVTGKNTVIILHHLTGDDLAVGQQFSINVAAVSRCLRAGIQQVGTETDRITTLVIGTIRMDVKFLVRPDMTGLGR